MKTVKNLHYARRPREVSLVIKRIFQTGAVIFAIALTVSVLSCSGEGTQDGAGYELDTIRDGITHTEPHSVPKRDFDGESFNSFYFMESPSSSFFTTTTATYYYFTEDEASGDPIKEARWKRTELIADHLNVKLTSEGYEGTEIVRILYDDMIAGGDSYQQVLLHCIYGISSLVSNGYVYDFNALPYVNLEADWWDLENMENLRLGKIYPYGVSDFVISAPHVITFNKTMVENLNLDNPYELVDNYKWTLDKMMEMAKSVTRNVQSDGRYRGEEVFGICTSEISKFNSFLMSCDQPVSKRGEDGRLELALNTEKTVKIIEKFAELANTTGAIHVDMNDYSGVYMDRIFAEGGCLFALFDPSFLESQRNAEIDYGIVPYPMYDEYQGEYKTLDWGVMWAIPAHIKNPELVGSVVELYSYFSRDTIVPAYYDKVLDGKLSNDLDSRRMLDIIFDSIEYEPINNYFGFHEYLGQISFVIGQLAVDRRSTDFASFYKGLEGSAKNEIKQFYANLEKNGGL